MPGYIKFLYNHILYLKINSIKNKYPTYIDYVYLLLASSFIYRITIAFALEQIRETETVLISQ